MVAAEEAVEVAEGEEVPKVAAPGRSVDARVGFLYLHESFSIRALMEKNGFAADSPSLSEKDAWNIFRSTYGRYTRNSFAKALKMKALKTVVLELTVAVSALRKSLRNLEGDEEEEEDVRQAARDRLEGLSRVGQKASLVLGGTVDQPPTLACLEDKFKAVEELVTSATRIFLTSLDQLSPLAIGSYPRDCICRRGAYFQLTLCLDVLSAELGKKGKAATALSTIHEDLPTIALRALGKDCATQMDLVSALEKQSRLCLLAGTLNAEARPSGPSTLGGSASGGGGLASGTSGTSAGGAGDSGGGSGAGRPSGPRGPVTIEDVRQAVVNRLVKDAVEKGRPLTTAQMQAIVEQANAGAGGGSSKKSRKS